MPNTEHTPKLIDLILPLEVFHDDREPFPYVGCHIGPLAIMDSAGAMLSLEEVEAIAQHLCRAVNSHAALVAENESLKAQKAALVDALKEASSLLAFLHGAFSDQLRNKDRERLKKAHAGNRAALKLAEEK